MLQAATRMNGFRNKPMMGGQKLHPKDSDAKGISYSRKFESDRMVSATAIRIPNLTVLRYGPRCQLYKYQRDMEEYARLEFGDLAQLFIDDQYYVPDPIEIGDVDDVDDLNQIDLMMYAEEKKLRLKEIYEMKKNRPKLFSAMWMQLSDESRARIMDQPNYLTEIKRGTDPLKLWLAIKETHMTAGAATAAINQYHADEAYQNLRMNFPDTLAIFLEKFNAAVKTISATGGTAPDETSQAVAFIMKLDSRFQQLQETLRNNDALGVGAFPATLSSAYNVASRFLVSNPRLQGRFHQGRKHSPGHAEAVFTTSEELPFMHSRGDNGSKRSSNKDKRHVECFKCGEMGHYANECKNHKDSRDNSSNRKPSDQRGGHGGRSTQASSKGHNVVFASQAGKKSSSKFQRGRTGGRSANNSRNGKDLVLYSVQEEDDLSSTEECAFTILPLQPSSPHSDNNSDIEKAVALFNGSCCCFFSDTKGPLDDFVVHLDNQASRSLVRNRRICKNVRNTGEFISFMGVGGSASTDLVGDIDFLGTVCILESSPVNIFALHEIEDKYSVSYEPGVSFSFELGDGGRRLVFERNDRGLYVCDVTWMITPSDDSVADEVFVATVAENERQFTKDQVDRARMARDLMITMGCTSAVNLIKLTRGIMLNCPVSAEDVYRASKIYGPLLGAVKGKTRIRKAGKVIVEHVPRPVESNLTLHSDIMFIEGLPFLVSVAMPIGLSICTYLASRSELPVRTALNNQIKQLLSRYFSVVRILVDGEGALYAMRHDLQAAGIVLETAGPNQHVPAVEVRIKIIKQIFRSIFTGLPYRLPKFLFKYLVYFAVSRINMYPVSSRPDPTPAKELFTGRKLDFKKDVRIGFGEYCQVDGFPNPRNSATKARTKGAISLDPKGNLQGTVRFFILGSEKQRVTVVSRDTWIKMAMTDDLIYYLNRLSDEAERAVDPAKYEPYEGDAALIGIDGIVVTNNNHVPAEISAEEELKQQSVVDEVATASGIVVDPPMIVPGAHPPISVDFIEDVIHSPVDSAGHLPEGSTQPIDDPPSAYALPKSGHLALTTLSYRKGLQKHGRSAMEAAAKEMKQMLEKDVWEPINWKNLPPTKTPKVIKSFMFLKEKFGPSGEFQKLKMRLVAGGHMQDRLDTDLISSPTVSLSTVLILFAYAARNNLVVTTVDITGAYLNASMVDSNVWMSVDSELVDALLLVDPSYSKYRRMDGSVVVRLKKALYGCIESAKLWYDHLAKSLTKFGLTPSKYDECLFSSSEDGTGSSEATNLVGKDLLVGVYVDDLLICGKSEKLVNQFVDFLRTEFGTITCNPGDIQAYIGINFEIDRSNGIVTASMKRYVGEVLAGLDTFEVKGCARTPATTDLFAVDDNFAPATDEQKVEFHSMVAKLLYLAKRVRPDLLTCVSFLATRVKEPNQQDLEKLARVIRYIRGSENHGIRLSFTEDTFNAYVDASHCVHSNDGKSQTGVFLTLGSGPFFVRSSKQKLVAKSSTEAELVAISDSLPALIWIRDLMVEQRILRHSTPITIYEDNQSTIALIRRGKPSGESTRHINIRHFFVTDRCKSGEVVMVYVKSEDQIADYFTKALVGKTFVYLREKLVSADVITAIPAV